VNLGKHGALVAIAVALAATGSLAGPASGQSSTPHAGPIPVIYDADMDVDDTSTLAYLCEQDHQGLIELLAVTVDNNGFGTPGRALRHAHSVLNDCGLPDVPVAGGSNTIVHAVPASAMQTVETVLTGALGDGSAPQPTQPLTGAQLIARTIAATPGKVTILTTGPLSNLATALRDAGAVDGIGVNWLTGRIQGLYVMGGAISVPGNLFGSALTGFDNSQEFNMWLDPPSARTVFHTLAPGVAHIVPLDATNFVPITPAFIDKLSADQQTVSARIVDRIMTQPAMTDGIKAGIFFWWDALAATSAFRNDAGITSFNNRTVDVVVDGVQSGRTALTPAGAGVRVALMANQTVFEQTFLNGLNGQ
jgi:purine nucleosidase